MEVADVHCSILRVLVEQALDLVRCFRCGQLELPAEAEADSVGLFGHRDSGILALGDGSVDGRDRRKQSSAVSDQFENMVLAKKAV